MRYEVTISDSMGVIIALTVSAGSELDAAYQAGITLALGRPASRIRAWTVTSVRTEAEALAHGPAGRVAHIRPADLMADTTNRRHDHDTER